MALSPATISAALVSASTFTGPVYPQLANGIGSGVYQWAVSSVRVIGQSTGVGLGPGSVTGKLQLAPNPSLILASLQGAGVAGLVSSPLATAVSTGIASAFTSSAQYVGVSSTVASGTDIATAVIADPASLVGLLIGTIPSVFGSSGPSLPAVATGLGNGIAALVATATGQGLITGAGSPQPSTGVSSSSIL